MQPQIKSSRHNHCFVRIVIKIIILSFPYLYPCGSRIKAIYYHSLVKIVKKLLYLLFHVMYFCYDLVLTRVQTLHQSWHLSLPLSRTPLATFSLLSTRSSRKNHLYLFFHIYIHAATCCVLIFLSKREDPSESETR